MEGNQGPIVLLQNDPESTQKHHGACEIPRGERERESQVGMSIARLPVKKLPIKPD